MVVVGAHFVRKIERHLAEDRLEIAIALRRLLPDRFTIYGRNRGGYIVLLGKDMPVNHIMRLGMRGRFGFGSAPDLASFEDHCRLMGTRPFIEICQYTPQWYIEILNVRGYQIDHFESILVRELIPEMPLAHSVTTIVIEPLLSEDAESWAYTAMKLSRIRIQPDHPRLQFALGASHSPQFQCFLARHDDQLVGTSAVSIRRELASLSFIGVHSAFRSHGIQLALIRHALNHVLSAGCTHLVTVETPETSALHNLIRAGFSNAYTRIVMTPK